MALNLNDLIFKKDNSGQLTTGAKIASAALTAGAAYLLLNKKKDQGNAATQKSDQQQQPTPIVAPEPVKKSNTGLYVGIGIGAVVVIGLIIFAAKSK